MLPLFFRSMGLHLTWFVRSLCPGGHPGAPLSWRRVLFLLAFPFFVAVQLVHWLGFLLDACLFPGYRKIRVEAPLFITGIPRSGTTFVHRTLSADPRFIRFRTWEAVLAPSITERKLLGGLARIDRALGRPLRRSLEFLIRRASGDFDAVHEVGLGAPEEDYLALLPAGGCFLLLLAFPFAPALRDLATFEDMPAIHRERLLDCYERCLQKRLFGRPEGARLLSKNAAFGSWVPELARRFPGARFILCVREPATALSSQLSSLNGARTAFGTDPDGGFTAELFADIFAHNYRSLATTLGERRAQAAVIDQADLKANPVGILRAALDRLGEDLSPELDDALNHLRPNPASGHRHHLGDQPVEAEQIRVCIEPAYQAILRAEQRISPPPAS